MELFAFTTPEQSNAQLDEIVALQEELFTDLGLHYQYGHCANGFWSDKAGQGWAPCAHGHARADAARKGLGAMRAHGRGLERAERHCVHVDVSA